MTYAREQDHKSSENNGFVVFFFMHLKLREGQENYEGVRESREGMGLQGS